MVLSGVLLIFTIFILHLAGAIREPQAKQIVDLSNTNGMPSINAFGVRDFSSFDSEVRSRADISGKFPKSWRPNDYRRGGINYKVGDSPGKVSAVADGYAPAYVDHSENGNQANFNANGANGRNAVLDVMTKSNTEKEFKINTDGGAKIDGTILQQGYKRGRVDAIVNGTKKVNARRYDSNGDWKAQATDEHNRIGQIDNLDDPTNIQYAGPRGKGAFGKNLTGSHQRQGNMRQGVNTIDQGTIQNVSVSRYSNPVYKGQVNENRNSATIYDASGNQEITDIRVIRWSESECDSLNYNNKFGKSRGEFDIEDDSVKIEMAPSKNSSGKLQYKWPGCFNIKMNMILPRGVDVRTLSAQVEVELPNRSKFVCPDEYNCGNYKCLYKDLCKAQSNPGLHKQTAVDAVLAESENNACTSQSGRRLPFTARVCPSEATYNDPRYKAVKTNWNVLEPMLDDVTAHIKLLTTPSNYQCSLFSWSWGNAATPTLVGCKKGTVSYAVKWFGSFEFSARKFEEEIRGGTTATTARATRAPRPTQAPATRRTWPSPATRAPITRAPVTRAPVQPSSTCPPFCKWFRWGTGCQNCV